MAFDMFEEVDVGVSGVAGDEGFEVLVFVIECVGDSDAFVLYWMSVMF